MKAEKKVQFNIYLHEDLVRAVKHAAVDANGSLSDYVALALKAQLQNGSLAPGSVLPTPPLVVKEKSVALAQQRLQMMPVIYAANIDASVRFYSALGFTVHARNRPGTWVELQLGEMLLALHHTDTPPITDSRVELAFVSFEPLEDLAKRLAASGVITPTPVVDEVFGRYLQMNDPDGILIQINEHDASLYV